MWLAYTSSDTGPRLTNLSLAAGISVKFSRNLVLIEGPPLRGDESKFSNVPTGLLTAVIEEIEFDSEEEAVDCVLKIKNAMRSGLSFFDLGELIDLKPEQ